MEMIMVPTSKGTTVMEREDANAIIIINKIS